MPAKPCVVEEVSTMSVKVRPYRGDTTGKHWEVDIRFEWPDGEVFRERKHTPCATEAAALRWGEAREREMFKKGKEALATEKKDPVPTFATFWERYMTDHCIASGHALSTLALKKTIMNANLKPSLGELRLDEIGQAEVDEMKAKLAHLSAKTVNNALSLLSNMLKKAKAWSLIDDVACTIEKRKAPLREAPFFTFETYAKLEKASEGARREDPHPRAARWSRGNASRRIIALRSENPSRSSPGTTRSR